MNTSTRDLSAVDRFADLIRATLELPKNAAKPDWRTQGVSFLLGLLRDEVRELAGEVTAPTLEPERVAAECADVGAIAMMIADAVGGLPVAPHTVRIATAEIRRGPVVAELEDARRDADRAWKRVALLEARIAGAQRALVAQEPVATATRTASPAERTVETGDLTAASENPARLEAEPPLGSSQVSEAAVAVLALTSANDGRNGPSGSQVGAGTSSEALP